MFPVLVLLASAVLLGGAAPALEPVTCSDTDGAAAARVAVHHINENHKHGYKFRLGETRGRTVEQVDDGCNVDLQLDLLETKCSVLDPKHFEDCETRSQTDQAVLANCTLMMTVKAGDAKVTKYECDVRKEMTNEQMVRVCPDCSSFIPLNSPEGLKSIHQAVQQFNQKDNERYYVLQEVGRIKSGYLMMAGTSYYTEFVLVETHCPMGSRIMPSACTPLCPDRARHSFCHSSYTDKHGVMSLECEFAPPANTEALSPGQQEPVCDDRPSKAAPGGPPTTDGLPPVPMCLGLPNTDPALHPICPWPAPLLLPLPRPHQA
ncbi:alpha-2-HS-glycoprotein 1 [Brachyistius frenatus]|uniref:alpha-2-HS-glycoprotein 1 n=1 Tax=Brachyistius frenatus TaxID=100188 RepID=UPI0037E90244